MYMYMYTVVLAMHSIFNTQSLRLPSLAWKYKSVQDVHVTPHVMRQLGAQAATIYIAAGSTKYGCM